MNATALIKNISVIFFISACQQPEVEPHIPEPIVAAPSVLERNVGPLVGHLEEVRWPCYGSGCLDSSDIARLAEHIYERSDVLGLEVAMMVGILMVENPWLDSLAVSSAGAVGLYQVMPMHRGAWLECDDAIETVSGSVCHGSVIIHDFLQRRDSRHMALLAYNGCSGGPCEVYPEKVSSYSEQFLNEEEP
jgi:hypothetical protein